MIIVLILTCFFLAFFNKMFNKTLDSYIDIEARKIASYVVTSSIKELDTTNINDYLSESSSGMKYNIHNITKLKNDLMLIIQNNFSKIESGDYSDYSLYINYNKNRYKYVRYGYLCDININSVNNYSLFANVGPNIPIKLSFLGDIIVDLEVNVKEYGINNAVVQFNVVVTINNQVSMPMSSKKHRLIIKEPLIVDIIKGKIPNYYSNIS